MSGGANPAGSITASTTGVHEDCETDADPPDAINPYAKPYDDALAGHLRLRDALEGATKATNAFGIALRSIDAN